MVSKNPGPAEREAARKACKEARVAAREATEAAREAAREAREAAREARKAARVGLAGKSAISTADATEFPTTPTFTSKRIFLPSREGGIQSKGGT